MMDNDTAGTIQGYVAKAGDSVQIDPAHAGKWLGQTFTVNRVLKTNAVLDVPGSALGLKCPLWVLVPADSAAATTAGVATFEPPLPMGTLTKVQTRPGLWVVLARNNDGRYRLARLGGDPEGRYLTRVGRSMLTVVEADTLATIEGLVG